MGLNIGIEITYDPCAYVFSRPQLPDAEKLEAELFAFLRDRFPEGGFGGGWVTCREKVQPDDPGHPLYVVEFDVRMFRYGIQFQEHHELNAMYLAIFEFILKTGLVKSDDYYLRVYYSG